MMLFALNRVARLRYPGQRVLAGGILVHCFLFQMKQAAFGTGGTPKPSVKDGVGDKEWWEGRKS